MDKTNKRDKKQNKKTKHVKLDQTSSFPLQIKRIMTCVSANHRRLVQKPVGGPRIIQYPQYPPEDIEWSTSTFF